jgi:hypothetical protein
MGVHVGGFGGFVEGCKLVYKAAKTTDYYRGLMDSGNYGKRTNVEILPNLATPSAIVTKNAPCRGKQADKPQKEDIFK